MQLLQNIEAQNCCATTSLWRSVALVRKSMLIWSHTNSVCIMCPTQNQGRCHETITSAG